MSTPITLPARLDLPSAMRLVGEMKAATGPMQIDGSAVTHLGALGLQALVAAARDTRARGDTFELCNGSEKMLEQMAIMGVTPDQLMEGTI